MFCHFLYKAAEYQVVRNKLRDQLKFAHIVWKRKRVLPVSPCRLRFQRWIDSPFLHSKFWWRTWKLPDWTTSRNSSNHTPVGISVVSTHTRAQAKLVITCEAPRLRCIHTSWSTFVGETLCTVHSCQVWPFRGQKTNLAFFKIGWPQHFL